jgi:hypothetical protein
MNFDLKKLLIFNNNSLDFPQEGVRIGVLAEVRRDIRPRTAGAHVE